MFFSALTVTQEDDANAKVGEKVLTYFLFGNRKLADSRGVG
jgi:hypothetical protein